MSDPTEPTQRPATTVDGTVSAPAPGTGLREGRTHGLGNFSRMRQDESAGAELAGGLCDPIPPAAATGHDPFDLDDAYPQGAELAGPLGQATPPDR